jgi:hypothetical protein
MSKIHSLICLAFLVVSHPSIAFSAPVVCSHAPAVGAPNPDEAIVSAAFTKAITDAPGCTAAGAPLCANTKTDLTALQADVLAAAITSENCAANGVSGVGGSSLLPVDTVWYTQRAVFWNSLYEDMTKNAASVTAGTYQISTAVQTQFLGLPLPVAPKAAPVPTQPGDKSTIAQSRISAGIDVSASAAVDPAANFLLDASFSGPFTNKDKLSERLGAFLWGSGYVRLASIAQPGAVSGLANMATYITPLTAATPNKLVQSAEANFALEHPFVFPKSLGDEFVVVSGVLDGGVITPLSVSQANPTIYVVNQAIYSYYTTPPVPNQTANTAITTACGTSFSSTTPCYLVYIPQDRTRFFRNYAGGLSFKKYYYNSADDSYGFPGYATVTFGQNEYVSGGRLQGVIMHVASSWPLPSTLSPKWGGSIYVYGAIDTNLKGKNTSAQQFLLQTAGSTITTTSNGVAVIPVPQADRDRYRFGVGVDVVKLISILTTKPQQ